MTAHAGEDASKGTSHSLLVGLQTFLPQLKPVWKLLKNMEIDLPQDPAKLLLGIYPKGTSSYHRYWFKHFIAALFISARYFKQPLCPLRKEQMKNMWYIFTMEYHSAI